VDRSARTLSLVVILSIVLPLIFVASMSASGAGSADLATQGLILAMTLPLLSLSVYMWITGKGAMLIAGHNTSPRAVRDLYDSRAMAKFVGKLVTAFLILLLIGLESLILGLGSLFALLLAAAIVLMVASIVYMNTGRRFLKEGADPSKVVMTPADKKRKRMVTLAALGVTGAVLAIAFFLSTTGSVSFSLEDDAFVVTAPFVDERILFVNISEVELRESFDNGRRVNGFGGTEISSGNFQNDELGRYTLARYNEVASCIVVRYDGEVLVFNLATAEDTASAYEQLVSRA